MHDAVMWSCAHKGTYDVVMRSYVHTGMHACMYDAVMWSCVRALCTWAFMHVCCCYTVMSAHRHV